MEGNNIFECVQILQNAGRIDGPQRIWRETGPDRLILEDWCTHVLLIALGG